jgi:hypothetical protein
MEGRMVYFIAGIFVLFSVASLIAGIRVGSDTYSRPPDVVAINAMRSDNWIGTGRRSATRHGSRRSRPSTGASSWPTMPQWSAPRSW